ncbi:asx tRNA synthetase class II [Fadolivirus algeromassiliense]|jgi:aspartyl/asparaginyl-tRNA synthetase|uniref:Asx tRNA synthetase class II n=1 Tax=Fadolivirus FV1/VV64 TaxID=3070911 RepID=A0A7D3UV71_9VIRU|nr:asx tRNA synthetase class II [Fadolivirus algeromassiliense]QKF93969.1 asx tRNA synthetase class II [Fadolivirus FV1/VV64]
MSSDHINPFEFDYINTKVREFFKSRGMVECFEQNKRTILAACEDPQNVGSYECRGVKWPLPQTNQMNLEAVILSNPGKAPGYFTYTTSYRFEENPVEGRHNTVFPMIEFELACDMDGLLEFEKDLLQHLGFGSKQNYKEGDYLDICKQYGVDELTHEHEQQLFEDYGPVFFLKNFPESTSPFWNMKRNNESGLAEKIDAIICGIETFGSANRSCDKDDMRNRFHTISDGGYADLLYTKFGKDRVEKELDEYLSYNFYTRSGAGIGYTRLARAMRMLGLLPKN